MRTRRFARPRGGFRWVATPLLLGVIAAVPSAHATPINPPQGATFTLNCDGTDVLVTVPSFLALTPRMSVDGHTRFIPVSLTLTITDLTTNEVLDFETLASRAPGAARLATATCVDIGTEVDPESGHLIQFNFTSKDIKTPVG